jgi:membrane-associated protease RseP (regulator of RpoE activity)
MTALLYLLGVLAFVLLLAASIALHECGHMVPAKKFGVRVPQFFVGFGRTVWSRRRGDTEYGVKAFPLGGYVKLVGMLPPEKHGRGAPRGLVGQLVADARAAEQEILQPGDEQRMFYRLPWWKKVIVMAGGPTVNLLIAFVIFGAVFAVKGVPEPTTTIATVSDCVKVVRLDQQPTACTGKDPVAPAKVAGLQEGDRIVSFGGRRITSYDQLQHLIRANGTHATSLVVVRDGTRRTLRVTTALNTLPVGVNSDKYVRAGFLGITPTEHMVAKGPGYTLGQMGDYTWSTVTTLGHLPAKTVGVAKAALGLQPRDPESPMSVVGVSRVAGQVASDQRDSVGDRIAFLFLLLAGVNLFVGMFNFVPLLPLDGGHIAGALYEGLRRGVARLLGRRDPGYVDVARLLPVAYVMVALFLVLTVVLVVGDIVAPVSV